MSKIRTHISMSLDGCVAGPNQSHDNPLGEGGEQLHDWVVRLKTWRARHGMDGGEDNASSSIVEQETDNIGAEIMGRGMFGPPEGGPWEESWHGWRGEDPPFHMPVFVLTHHAREPLTLSDTTFNFVTDGRVRPRAGAGGRGRQGRLHRRRGLDHQPVPSRGSGRRDRAARRPIAARLGRAAAG